MAVLSSEENSPLSLHSNSCFILQVNKTLLFLNVLDKFSEHKLLWQIYTFKMVKVKSLYIFNTNNLIRLYAAIPFLNH